MSSINGWAVRRDSQVEFIRWTGENMHECVNFLGANFVKFRAERRINGVREIYFFNNGILEKASKGDVILAKNSGYEVMSQHLFKLLYQVTEGTT